MSRSYSVSFAGTVTNAGGDVDLLEITPAAAKPVRLRGMLLGQTSEPETEGEALRLSVLILPATVTAGTGGSAVTPTPPRSGLTAAGFTAACNNAGVATTSGTAVTHLELSWNVLARPTEFAFEDGRFLSYAPLCKPGEVLVVRQRTTAADDYSAVFTFFLEEEGSAGT